MCIGNHFNRMFWVISIHYNISDEKGYNWQERHSQKYNKCFPRFETKFKEKCENYEETSCYTKHKEKCDTITFQNCALVPKENHERKCETVNEQICHLKKTYENEEVVDYVPKQKCHKTTSMNFYFQRKIRLT